MGPLPSTHPLHGYTRFCALNSGPTKVLVLLIGAIPELANIATLPKTRKNEEMEKTITSVLKESINKTIQEDW